MHICIYYMHVHIAHIYMYIYIRTVKGTIPNTVNVFKIYSLFQLCRYPLFNMDRNKTIQRTFNSRTIQKPSMPCNCARTFSKIVRRRRTDLPLTMIRATQTFTKWITNGVHGCNTERRQTWQKGKHTSQWGKPMNGHTALLPVVQLVVRSGQRMHDEVYGRHFHNVREPLAPTAEMGERRFNRTVHAISPHRRNDVQPCSLRNNELRVLEGRRNKRAICVFANALRKSTLAQGGSTGFTGFREQLRN